MTDETGTDRIAQLEDRIAQLEQRLEAATARGPGTSHVFGRNPLVEKYASLGSQVFTVIRAGGKFVDTQGNFYPVVISRTGIEVNTSTNFPAAITFHDTKNLNPIDLLLGEQGSGALALYPETTDTPVFFTLQDAPTVAGTTRSIYLYSGFSASNPSIGTVESTGTRTIYQQAFIERVKAGIPVDGDFDVPASGMCVVDSSNNRVYFRVGSTWKYAALT